MRRSGVRDHAYLTEEVARELDRRLRRLEGQASGVRRMLAREAPCEEILIQTSAIRGALNQITILLLEGHVDACLARWPRDRDGREAIRRTLERSFSQVLKRS